MVYFFRDVATFLINKCAFKTAKLVTTKSKDTPNMYQHHEHLNKVRTATSLFLPPERTQTQPKSLTEYFQTLVFGESQTNESDKKVQTLINQLSKEQLEEDKGRRATAILIMGNLGSHFRR